MTSSSVIVCVLTSLLFVVSVTSSEWEYFTLLPLDGTNEVDSERLMEDYSRWHTHMFNDVTIDCVEKKILLFEVIGDELGQNMRGLASAFVQAIRTGRLFFIDWTNLFDWKLGFRDLPFEYDYNSAIKRHVGGKSLICDPRHKSAVVSGQLQWGHPITMETTINNQEVSVFDMMTSLFKPSSQVLVMTNSLLEERSEDIYQISLVIETGKYTYNQFLSPGDELNFLHCFTEYIRMFEESWHKFRVFIASDCAQVKAKVVKFVSKLARTKFNMLDIQLSHLHNSTYVTIHNNNRWVETVAEFFAISRSDGAIITHGSSFGYVATKMGEAAMAKEGDFSDEYADGGLLDVLKISDSNCDKRETEHSCNWPKYPRLCAHLLK